MLAIGSLLQERYQITAQLQERGALCTYAAEDQQTHQQVIVKSLWFKALKDWKVLELFEREAKTLASLDHPRIPKLIDSFSEETDGGQSSYLISERVHGENLAKRLDSGWKVNQAKAIALAQDLLDILVYLHQFSPPVIHRDLKPSNIMLDEADRAYLIDFGAVKDLATSGDTVVGTFGYMPPEQFSGQVKPISDLYSLGVTLVYTLSRCPPEQIPRRDLHLDYHDLVNISTDFQIWLDALLEPAPSQRIPSAAEALAQLKALEAGESLAPLHNRTPPNPAPAQMDKLTPTKSKPVKPKPPVKQELKSAPKPKLTEIRCRSPKSDTLEVLIPAVHGNRLGKMVKEWLGFLLFIGLPCGLGYYFLSAWLPFWLMALIGGTAFLFWLFMGVEINRSLFYSAQITLEPGHLTYAQGWRKKQLESVKSHALDNLHWIDFGYSYGFTLHLNEGVQETIYLWKTPEERKWLRYEMLKQMQSLVPETQFQKLLSEEALLEEEDSDYPV